MSSIDKLSELRRKEMEIDKIFDQLKEEKKKEAIQNVKELLEKNENGKARVLIEKIEELEEIKWERNEHVLSKIAQIFHMQEKEIDYEQLRMEHDRVDNIKEIENIFLNQLKDRGFSVQEKKADVWQLRKDDEVVFFFEADGQIPLATQIEKKIKYTSILVGVNEVREEQETEKKIAEWLANLEPSKKESIKKYLKLKITSKERLSSEMESTKNIKIA